MDEPNDEPSSIEADEGSAEQPDLASRLDALASQIGISSEGLPTSMNPAFPPIHTEGIHTIVEQPTEGALSEGLADLRTSIEERLAVLEDSLQSVCDRIESLARDGISVTGEGIERLAEGVRTLDERLGNLSSGDLATQSGMRSGFDPELVEALSSAMGQALTDLADAVGESLRAQGQSVAGALQETRAALTAQDQQRTHDVIPVSRAELAEALGEVAALAASSTGALDATVRQLQDTLASRPERDEQLAQTVAESSATAASAEVSRVVSAGLESSAAAVSAEVSRVVSAALSDALDDLTASLTAAQSGPLAEEPLSRAEMAEALGEIAVRLLEGQEVISEGIEVSRTQVADDAHRLDAQISQLAQALTDEGQRRDAQISELAQALTEEGQRRDAQISELAQALTEEGQRRDAQHAQLAQALAASTTAAADADEVVVAESMRTAETLRSVFGELQGQRNLLIGLIDEVRRSINRVDGAMGGVAAALVRYLGERDRLLELERADIERDMLVQFAEGLKSSERKRVGSRISEALDHRADARDAGRWRDASLRPVSPATVDEADLATLSELLDRYEGDEALLGPVAVSAPPAPARAPKKATRKAPAKAATSRAAGANMTNAGRAPRRSGSSAASDQVHQVAPTQVRPAEGSEK